MESDMEYPIYDRGTTVHSENPWNYICHICPEKRENPLEDHLKDDNHLQRLQYYTQFFTNTGPLVDCKLCIDRMSLSQVIDHALSHKLIPWYVSDNSPEILFKNFISQRQHQYFCHLCNVQLPFWFTVEHHNEDSHHQTLKRDKIDEVILQDLSFTTSYYQLAVSNSIFMKSSKCLSCDFCGSEVGTLYDDIVNHIEGKCHKKNQRENIRALESVKNRQLSPDYHNDSGTLNIPSNVVTVECNNNSEDRYKLIPANCTICNCEVDTKDIDAHWSSHKSEEERKAGRDQELSDIKTIVNNLDSKKKATSDRNEERPGKLDGEASAATERSENRLKTKKPIKFTSSTDIPRTSQKDTVPKKHSSTLLIAKPLSDITNVQKLPEGITRTVEKNSFMCGICHLKLDGHKDIFEHAKGKRHIKNLHDQKDPPMPTANNEGVLSNGNTGSPGKFITINNDVSKNEKIPGKYNAPIQMQKPIDHIPEGIVQVINGVYECTICQFRFSALMFAKDHVETPYHRTKVLQLSENKSDSMIPQQSVHSSFSSSSKSSISHEDDDISNGKLDFVVVPAVDHAQDLSNGDPAGKKSKQCGETSACLDRSLEKIINVNKVSNNSKDEILPKGIIQVSQDLYECSLCKCTVKHFRCMVEHVKGLRHRIEGLSIGNTGSVGKVITINRKTISGKPNSSLQNGKFIDNIPEGIINVSDRLYECTICLFKFFGLKFAKKHVETSYHRAKALQLSSNKSNSIIPQQTVHSSLSKSLTLHRDDGISNRKLDLVVPVGDRRSKQCGKTSACLDGSLGKVMNLNNASKNSKDDILPKGIIQVSKDLYKCSICNCMLSHWRCVEEHVKGFQHRNNVLLLDKKSSKTNDGIPIERQTDNLPKGITHVRKNVYSCAVCNHSSLGIKDIPGHVKGLRHNEKLRLRLIVNGKGLEISKVSTAPEKPEESRVLGNGEARACSTQPCGSRIRSSCDTLVADSYAAKASVPPKKKSTTKRQRKLQITGKVPCLICGVRFENQKELHTHLTKHFWKRFNAVSKSLETQTNDKDKDPIRIPDIQSTESPDDREDLEYENEGYIVTQLELFDSPRNSKTRNLDIALDDKLNIYDVDRRKINDLKLGLLLSFTIDQDNIYCLVCVKSVKNTLQNFYEHLCSGRHLDYLQRMIEDHRKFKDYPDQLSDLALAHEYMEEVSEDDVQCRACGISVKNESINLNEHINDPSHTKKWSSLGENSKESFKALSSRMDPDFYSTRRYWCVLCEMGWSVEIDFRQHLNEKEHKEKIAPYKNGTLMFDYCALCATLWYGFMKTYSHHSTCKMHKNQTVHSYYLVNKIPHFAEKLLHRSEKNIEEILTNVDSRRVTDKKKENQLIRNLEKISMEEYPSVKAYPFGSRVSGLAGRNSDLDIFFDCSTESGPVYSEENSSHEQILVRLENIKKCLEKNPQNWHVDHVVRDCRIPIIRATHRPTGIECDISFTSGLSVETTKMIKAYCEGYSHCRKLIIFVKNWMGHCELTGVTGISSYGIAWLVIYFLQLKMILPTISELMEKGKDSRIIGGWETGASTNFQPRATDESFRELLTQFFRFYADFDYRNFVICPLVGRAIRKKDFQKRTLLPDAMKPYFNYLERADDPEPFRIDSVMCLQDPFHLAHNVSRALTKFMVYRFKTLCSLSAKILVDDA